MKKVIMGIIAFLPAGLLVLYFILSKLADIIGYGAADEGFTALELAAMALIYIYLLVYIVSVIVYFIYNLKNQYIYPDKRVGWGYMLVCIGIVAMPAYWYNFIRVRGR